MKAFFKWIRNLSKFLWHTVRSKLNRKDRRVEISVESADFKAEISIQGGSEDDCNSSDNVCEPRTSEK